MTEENYKPHIFISFSVHDVREALEDMEKGEYPLLTAMTDAELDEHLKRCWRELYNIWHTDGGLDLDELERLIR